MKLKSVVAALRKVDIEKIAWEAFKENEHHAIDLNTQSQLFEKGVDAKGDKLKEYTPFTKMLKRQKGQPTDRTTLKDEGDFHAGFYVKSSNFPVIFDSRDSKTGELVFKYGQDIFGLTEESKEELRKEHTNEAIQEKFQREVGNAFRLLR